MEFVLAIGTATNRIDYGAAAINENRDGHRDRPEIAFETIRVFPFVVKRFVLGDRAIATAKGAEATTTTTTTDVCHITVCASLASPSS